MTDSRWNPTIPRRPRTAAAPAVRGGVLVRLLLLGIPILGAGPGLLRAEDGLEPIRFGRVELSPSLGLDGRYEDNVERTNEEDPVVGQISSFVREFRPELQVAVPLRTSFLQVAYRGALKQFSAVELAGADGWTHYFELQGRFQLAPALRLDVGDKAVDGVTEYANFIPGGELRFTTQPLRSNNAFATLAIDGGGLHSVEIGATRNGSHFETGGTSTSEYKYLSEGLFGRYLLKAGGGNQVYLSLDYATVEQDRGVKEIEPDDYRVQAIGTGLRRQSSRDMGSEIRVAFADTDFVGGTGTPFRGLMLEATLNGALGPASQWSVRMRRGPQVSFFNRNAYYLNNLIEGQFRQAIGPFVGLEAGISYQHNAYPEEVNVYVTDPEDAEFDVDGDGIIDSYANLLPSQGVRRVDDLLYTNLSVRWSLGRAVDLTLGYRMEKADSNIESTGITADKTEIVFPIFDYDSHTVHLLVAFGWQ